MGFGLDDQSESDPSLLLHRLTSAQAHPTNDTLYVLVGDTSLDDVYWGGDQNIPMPRPSYQINSTRYANNCFLSLQEALLTVS